MRRNNPGRRIKVFFILFIMLIMVFFQASCGSDSPFMVDDLESARKAYAMHNLPLTERLLERYLRAEKNPEKRWEAWTLLLQALNANGPEPRASLECLQSMLVEYETNEPELDFILSQMGKYNALLRHYAEAANAWSAWLELGEVGNEAKVEGYRQLAAMQFNQRHFDAGEETLQQCLGLTLPDKDKIMCLLDLAYENMARERWQEAVDLCQQIEDSNPDETVSGLAGFVMGDALEQMGRDEEALKLFEKYRDLYPNPAVMDNRIEYLRKNINIRKDPGKKN